MKQTPPIAYVIQHAIVAPLLVCLGASAFAFIASPWWILAIPFAVLASYCAQPNLNMADGCLAYLSILTGGMLLFFHSPSGIAIIAGVSASMILSAIEKRITAKPVYSMEDFPVDKGSSLQGCAPTIRRK